MQEDGKFMIDNSQLGSDKPGLAFRRTPSLDDRLEGVATYGSVIEGELVNGFVKLTNMGAWKQMDSHGVMDGLSVVVFGATGDLAKKKLFPALYQLMYGCPDAPLLPVTTRIIGYGRSHVELDAFLAKQCTNVKGEHRDKFLQAISYFQGTCDSERDFARLHCFLQELEGGGGSSRIFFMSVPATVFGCVCENIHQQARAPNGFTRLIFEKPFGRDSRSFEELNATTLRCF
jgi:glucose-6-phosphate 1-dehydrogenase